MRRLLARSLYLCALCALFIGVSRSYGSQQAEPARLKLVGLLNCALPCWNGIEIGKTTQEVAFSHLVEAFPDYDVESWGSFGRGQFQVDGTVVTFWEQSITLQKKDNPQQSLTILLVVQDASRVVLEIGFVTIQVGMLPSIPELSAALGAPRCVIQNPGRGNTPLVTLFEVPIADPPNIIGDNNAAANSFIYVAARILGRGYGWQQSVYELRIATTSPVPITRCQQWHGFTNLSRHLPSRP